MTATEERPADLGALALTESQHGLLVLDQQLPVRQLYNMLYEIELSAAVPPERLRAALAQVTVVQPSLRTVFRNSPTAHARVVEPLPDSAMPFEAHELIDDAQIAETVDRLGAATFDLAHGPLFRAVYLHTASRGVLVFVVHHLAYCHFSNQAFLDELHLALTTASDPADTAELRASRERQYVAEFAAQAKVAADEATSVQARELADHLRDVPATSLYPHPERPAETRFVGTRITAEIGGAEARAIRSVCAEHDLRAYDFFMTAYAATVGRHSASSTPTIANVFFARRTAGSLNLLGFFVNTLPVTVPLDWSAGFDEHAGNAVHEAVEHSRARSKVAFSRLVEVLRPERVGTTNPVFSSLFAMYDAPRLPGSIAAVRAHGNHTAKFDLWLGVTEIDDGWRVEFEYDVDRFPAEVATEIQRSFLTAVRRASTDVTTPLADLFPDASTAASTDTDGHWAGSVAPSLAEWFHGTASRCGDRVAVADGDVVTTYAELAGSVAQVAAALAAHGVRPGDVVGIRLDGLADTVTAMFGIMHAGAAFLPLDDELPTDRLAYMVAKAGCSVVIGSIDLPGTRSISLGQLAGTEAAVGPPVRHERAATYVMFTSGSTGQPKGIHMRESALLNLTAWQIAALAMTEETRFLQYAPLGFDVSFQEIVPTLCAGGTVVSRTPAVRQDFPAVAERIRRETVTHAYLPVAALRPFAQSVLAVGTGLGPLTHLCVSGEQLIVDDEIRRLFDENPSCRLVNLYGPTETSATVTKSLGAPAADWPRHVPIGRPMTNVAAYVVDVTGHLAPRGVPGELYLGGECPAFGYLNDPDKTAAGFLPDRFAGHGTSYRTGDLVLRDATGELIFLGRGDDQVKIRGYRVELGDVETAARAVDGVRHAVAATRIGMSGRELVLFAVTDGVPAAAVRDALRRALPAYMVPAFVQLVDTIPTTANGKVDRAALLRCAKPTGTETDPVEAVEYRDEVERQLAEIWATLLGVPSVRTNRSILEYGAHSIMMFNSLTQINAVYDVDLTIVDLFGALTIAELAALVRERLD
ncbi:amino acid adenylation domain-containing protein [Amycolatopsis mediterranei]|uniref:non-ribosomal peptide synthetase n=1 Tax=Amycolatopsis mediterranei TaxID=33910 RepID=UPI0034380A7E